MEFLSFYKKFYWSSWIFIVRLDKVIFLGWILWVEFYFGRVRIWNLEKQEESWKFVHCKSQLLNKQVKFKELYLILDNCEFKNSFLGSRGIINIPLNKWLMLHINSKFLRYIYFDSKCFSIRFVFKSLHSYI